MSLVRYSPHALKDLEDIQDYIASELASPRAAFRVVSQLMDRIESLSYFPEGGSSIALLTGIDSEYRFLAAGALVAVYHRDGEIVSVDRVFHRSRDVVGILLDL